MSGEKGFCPHKDPEYDGPSNFWCDDCAEIKDRIKDRDQRRYEIAKDVMAALVASGLDHSPTVLAPMAVEHADELLEALVAEGRRRDGLL